MVDVVEISYPMKVLEGVSPLIRDIHEKHFRDVVIPFQHFHSHTRMTKVAQRNVSKRIRRIRKSCLPFSKDKLPRCFYHIINFVFDFPYEPKLAAITSELLDKIDFDQVPAELSYILLDAMHTVYGDSFSENMKQIAFALELDWNYTPKGTGKKNCGNHDYDDLRRGRFRKLAHCIYHSKGHGSIKDRLFRMRMQTLRQACSHVTLEGIPTCFYHLIKTFRAYPEAPELFAIIAEMGRSLHMVKDMPPPLAYLVMDTMRSVYGTRFIYNFEQRGRVRPLLDTPWEEYRGDERAGKEL